MDKKLKQNLILVICGALIFAILMNFSSVISIAGTLLSLMMPVIVGAILALFISVPVCGTEKIIRKIFAKRKHKPSEKTVLITSFIFTIICILLAITLVTAFIVPALLQSVQSIYSIAEKRIPDLLQYMLKILSERGISTEWISKIISKIDLEGLMKNVSSYLTSFLSSFIGVISSTVNITISFVFAVIIAIYMVLDKKHLCRSAKYLVYAYLKKPAADRITYFCSLFGKTFAKFLSGQCFEAIILGVLMFIAFSVFRLPYASLVGVITAFCALLPYVGATLSCVVSVLLAFIVDPSKAILCVIVYLCVQFIENQFIYPHVVGNSVGLSALYTLVAALIGGSLFGIIGILFFIPLTAVIIAIIKENSAKRLSEKGLYDMISENKLQDISENGHTENTKLK